MASTSKTNARSPSAHVIRDERLLRRSPMSFICLLPDNNESVPHTARLPHCCMFAIPCPGWLSSTPLLSAY